MRAVTPEGDGRPLEPWQQDVARLAARASAAAVELRSIGTHDPT